ncbi:unnamed protein product [Onchocerca flexuosa]|uniref:Guanylate kinase-like domain-containing protein n=1 Tax=Onchocerca flexuosa TaxID=387005 RepID=A0A183I762_9BILA|nr:unnamed protein product [Onchocerca flexuosa]
MKPIVISGPSGGGKSTVISKAMEAYPNAFAFAVSHTTRKSRPGEIDGKSYWFVTEKKFKEMIENNEFLEYATFGGNMYGTSYVSEERLRARKTETEESLKKRMKHAEEDLNAVDADPSLFDFVIINDDFEQAYNDFLMAIKEELNEVASLKGQN